MFLYRRSQFFFLMPRRPPRPTLFPYTTLFRSQGAPRAPRLDPQGQRRRGAYGRARHRSEEHTSELQSPYDLVCRLLLEKKILLPDTSIQRSHTSIPLLTYSAFSTMVLVVRAVM